MREEWLDGETVEMVEAGDARAAAAARLAMLADKVVEREN